MLGMQCFQSVLAARSRAVQSGCIVICEANICGMCQACAQYGWCRWIQEHLDSDQQLKFHFFNTFFYKKLTEKSVKKPAPTILDALGEWLTFEPCYATLSMCGCYTGSCVLNSC